MAISKVVYGTTVLVDLTSDTVDAAHLAKGCTAHDAGGNLIVGTLESQADSNLLHGITPSLFNGATQSGKTYVIPNGGESGTEYIEYQLDIPKLTSDVTYNLLAYGKTQEGYRSVRAELYFKKLHSIEQYDEVSSTSCSFLFGASGAAKAGSLNLKFDAYPIKPMKLVLKNANNSIEHPLNISSIMLMMLEA